MKRLLFPTAWGGLSLCVLLVACKAGGERKISKNEVPDAVTRAYESAYPNAAVQEFSEETEDGNKIYEVALIFEGRKLDVSYNASGEPLEVEETIPPDSLPAAVQQKLTSEYSAATLGKVERVSKAGKVYYEIHLKQTENNREKRFEVKFDENANLIKSESDEDDDQD